MKPNIAAYSGPTKYLKFRLFDETPKTVRVVVSNQEGYDLGLVNFHSPWRQYVYATKPRIIWSSGCLYELRAFIAWLNREQRRKN